MKKYSFKLPDDINFREIKELHDKYSIKLRYSIDENILKKAINHYGNEHKDIEIVYFKSTLINSFYSTRMGADLVYFAAKKICDFDLDLGKIICEGPTESNLDSLSGLLNKISEDAVAKANEKGYHPYSFFTKYIAIHNRILHGNTVKSKFPIYDNLVEKVIKHLDIYEKFCKSSDFTNVGKDLRIYKNLYYTIKYFAGKMNFDNFTDTDQVLWLLGKYIYPPRKNKEKQVIRNIDFSTSQQLIEEIKKELFPR